jgi:hypothetical protein
VGNPYIAAAKRHAILIVWVPAVLVGCGSLREGSSPAEPDRSSTGQSAASSTVVTLAPSQQAVAASPDLFANDVPELPPGDDGVVAIVAVGDYDRVVGLLPLVVRNNTSGTTTRVSVSGEARNANGNLIAAGEDQGLVPNVVEVGELAIGYVYFEGAKLPDNAEISLEATGEPLGEFENIVAIPIEEAYSTSNGIVGTAKNISGTRVTGPISVEAVCFSNEGELTDEYRGFATKDALADGERSSFQLDVYGEKCERFLLGASGFTST